ncbi:MAG: hypothetical protein HDR02_10470 [Lachnospiraceae bacterium]|nr:hypothetical protein [Lachnospiraceae bacterium]
MGRKGIKPKLLMCAVALSTMVSGILGSVPLSVKAAEEENYTVTFEAYEGTCETESISVPRGESLTLPEAVYEGHYLESWMDITNNEGVAKFTAVGKAGDTYTPERDMWLYANWKQETESEGEPGTETEEEQEPGTESKEELEPGTGVEEELEPETGSEEETEQETELEAEEELEMGSEDETEEKADISYEARIGGNYYEDIESAFENAQDGDTITVLRDCSASKTLVASAANLTLTSEDAGNPAIISRDEEFEGKNYYKTDINNVLLGIEGSLTTRDIILDGGAELDSDFNNTGQVWDGPMVYVKGTCTMEDGTVLQNNYNTNNKEEYTSRSAGALHVEWGGTFTMNGGLIHHCYTNGGGGGIQTGRTSNVTITAGTIRDCRAYVGGAIEFYGPASVSGMTISGNKARAATVGIHGEVTLSDCIIENNVEESDGGTVSVSENSPVIIEGCIIRGNRSKYTSAISYSGISRTEPLTIRDCTITGNVAEDQYSGSTITYMTKAPLILDGKIVMEGNTVADGNAGDIRFYYEDATPVTLGADFESGSVFVMSGRNSFSGAFLVDAASNGKEADASQFVWKSLNYRTEEKEGNIYLAEMPKTYFVTYDVNNNPAGSSIMCSDPNKYTSEDTVVIMGKKELFPLMGNLVYFGYDFDGWNTEADGTGTDYMPGQEINLTDNLYLYAKWKPTAPVTLTYIYNGDTGETESEQVIPGANIAFPDASRKGYSFKGWYEDEELTVFAGNAGEKHYAPQQDASYYAAWEKEEATVTFDADGGKMEGGNVTAKIGDTITLPDCTKDGYEFVGWYDGDTCTGQAGEEYTVSDDVTLKAHYVKKGASTGTITFDADGGEMEGGDITAKIGDTVTLPLCTKDGYEFVGWYDNDICAGQAGEKYTVTGDVVLKARYEKKAEVTYLITFDPNGGRKADHIRAAKGEKITLPGTEKSGYVFLGWYTEKENGILLGLAGDKMEVTKDMTVYALWEKEKAEENGDKDQETCKAVFHTEGGTLKNKSVTIAKGASLYLPLPEREGYDFTGWYLDQSLTQFAGIYRDSYRITKDTDFYAKWEKSKENSTDQGSNEETTGTYTVKYDANGGTVKESSAKVAKGAGVKLPAAEREGYTFKGWYTDKQVFVGMAGDTYKPEGDICLYAKWENAASGNSDNSTTDTDNNNSSDTNAGTSTDSSATGESVDTAAGISGTAAEREPVIQTGRTSPIYLLAALGMFGILLAALSICEGKRSSME